MPLRNASIFGQVHAQEHRPELAFGQIRAELVGERFAGVGIDIEERDLRALIEEMLDERRANAGRAAGDQHHLAGEARIAREAFYRLNWPSLIPNLSR